MIDLYGIVSIPFLKKSAFTGSFRKMSISKNNNLLEI